MPESSDFKSCGAASLGGNDVTSGVRLQPSYSSAQGEGQQQNVGLPACLITAPGRGRQWPQGGRRGAGGTGGAGSREPVGQENGGSKLHCPI